MAMRVCAIFRHAGRDPVPDLARRYRNVETAEVENLGDFGVTQEAHEIGRAGLAARDLDNIRRAIAGESIGTLVGEPRPRAATAKD